MFTAKAAFSGFSVDDLAKAKDFYTKILGLEIAGEDMGLQLRLPNNSGTLFIYDKEDHQPATYTNLNFAVENIDTAVDELAAAGVTFEQYDWGENGKTDEKGIMHSPDKAKYGPSIAWFKDPAGNILSVLED